MILRVDATSALPVYEQIRSQVTRMVVAGTLDPGTRLPTIRQLANDLQVAKGTVAKAYALLEEGAVIETRGRRGSFTLPPAGAAEDGARPGDGADDGAAGRARLAEAAEAFAVTARQLGVQLGDATAAVERSWSQLES
jgi:DNA-binding transcriptional MocR family regulator